MRPVSHWSIAQRLGSGFAVLLLILAALVGLVSWQIAQNDRASEALDALVLTNQRIDEYERSVLLVAVSTRDVLLARTTQQLGAYEDAERRLREALRTLQPDASTREMLSAGNEYVTASRRAVTQGDLTPADLVPLRQAALASARAFSAQQDAAADSALKRMRANREMVTASLYAGAAITGLLFLGIAILTTRSVSLPARELVVVAAALRHGDWRPALQLAGQEANLRTPSVDEITQIGRAFGAAAAELELREQRLQAQAAIARASGASLDRSRIAEAVLRTAVAQVGAEVGALYVKGTEEGVLLPVAARCIGEALQPVRVGVGLVGQCARDKETVVWRDIPHDSPFAVGLGYDKAPPRRVVATPLLLGGELLGVLVVASLREVDDGGMSFLDAAASIVAVGLMNARTYEEVQQLLTKVRVQSDRIQSQNEELQAQNEELQAQNEELQAQGEELQAQGDDLQRQTAQLHEQAGALRQADVHRNEFLGLLAHELRNPLTPITNCVELLGRSSDDPRVVAQVEEILGRQVRHMTHLVDDLLDVTRVTRGKVTLQREQLNVTELVRQCIDDHRGSLDKAGLELTMHLPDVPIHVDGDHTRICQVFLNLLSNAVKFCRPGSSVNVEVSLDPPERSVAIHVADTGEGIEPAILGRIFEPFFQADGDLARTRGGLGLGLALAKGLVELHGGRIEARSAGKGRGAEFIITLPLADKAGADSGAAEGGATPLGTPKPLSARVLVIDDNADAARSLAALLELEGCQVRVAETAPAGLDVAMQFRPEAILCDIGLPGMDGYAFARKARQHPQLRPVLLVALTGYSAPSDLQRAEDAGFDAHVTKPPDYERVLDLLRNPAAARRPQARANLRS